MPVAVRARAFAALVLGASLARAAEPIPFVSTDSSPAQIAAAPSGILYWVQYSANSLGYRRRDGVIGSLAITTPGSGPISVTVGRDGYVWFAAASIDKIGR